MVDLEKILSRISDTQDMRSIYVKDVYIRFWFLVLFFVSCHFCHFFFFSFSSYFLSVTVAVVMEHVKAVKRKKNQI